MTEHHGPLLAFSDFVFDPATGELTRNGFRIRMGKQVSDLLAVLLEHPEELVTREQIREVLWPERDQIDFEKVINNGISRLRYLFGDDPKNPRYIERIPKRGYRLLVKVERIGRAASRRTSIAPDAESARILPAADLDDGVQTIGLQTTAGDSYGATIIGHPSNRSALHFRFGPGLMAAVSATLLSVTAFVAIHIRKLTANSEAQPQTISLEVAPMDADSPDSQQLAERFQLDLLDALAQLPQLRVHNQHFRTNTSVAAPARNSRDLATILYGRFFRSLDNCHLEFELVLAADGTHLASFQYNGTISQLAAIREKLQQDIFLRLRLTRERGLRGAAVTSDQEAYNDYLLARFHFWQQSNDSLRLAVAEYQDAIDRDKTFAAAYAGLGRTLLVMGDHGVLPQREAFQRSSDAITTAFRLDPASPEVHGVNGLIYAYRDWDLAAGESEVRQAIALDPTQAIYHQWLAILLCIQGECDTALKEIDLAHADAPNWPPVYITEVFVAGNGGDFKRLLSACRSLKALTADSAFARDATANALWYNGQPLQAIAEWRAMALAEHDKDRVAIEDEGLQAYSSGGTRAYAQVRLDAIASKRTGIRNHPNDFDPIEWNAAAGENDRAITGLKNLAAQRDPDFLENIQSPGLISLHKDKRFLDLMEQANLALAHR